ncbi:MAG: alpha/beta fold hydrolase, partial [Actinomycetota bacterium]
MAVVIESSFVEPVGFTPFGAWPGSDESHGTFVRRTPVLDPTATRTVYVHGLGGSSLNWTDLMGLRMPTSPGIAIDLPGFGRSSPAARHTLDAHAAAVVALLDAEKCGPVDLIGNSMGGATSILVAARRPDLVRSLTLIGPALPGQRMRVEHLPILLAGVPRVREKRYELMHRRLPEQRDAELLSLVYFAPSAVTADRPTQAA